MASQRTHRHSARRTKIEQLEERQMFSAEPLGGSIEQHSLPQADFWYDNNIERDLDSLLGDIEQNLASAHLLTGLTQASNDYGFTGVGQTVVVIDSGIAWDHPNLGNGFGSGFRVVGGWDFTEENDANPYDDGPAGSHGTHVSGIIGASANGLGDVGVAPGVDLVGLRVFNDQGSGYFSWVERALQWVHTNRNAFANPITAINLSLGTSWNAATVPNWTTLEDEFAQLKADGIFIAVSAGNSFATYNSPGLSYPAASPSVVPVMSVDDSGSLSYFSQRHSRAIAAPGRSIRSTVPDYVGNQNGVSDDWANFSGTSMASPYVAGASVLVREAMQFVGITNITQDTIYSHMLATATTFFDLATNQNYQRLNVAAALDALMPTDDFGSSIATAHNLGAIGASGTEISGLIGKRSDADFFRFTAAATGTVTITADTTHFLAAAWTGSGAVSGANGNTYALDVVAGQSYVVGLSSSNGIGYFDLSFSLESVFTYADWGTIAQTNLSGVSNSGETWYRVTASQAGSMTAEALFDAAGGNIELAWFDANLQPVAGGTATSASQRADRLVAAGEQLYLRVTGANADVDFRLTNLVSFVGSTVSVTGTAQDDNIVSAGGNTLTITINGAAYQFDASAVSDIFVDGNAGNDVLTAKAGNTAAIHATEIESVVDLDATAIALNQDLGLNFSKGYYLNYSGFNEKWILGTNYWYIITPDGALYRAAGSNLQAMPLIAQLDSSYYNDPSLLHEAGVTNATANQQLLHQVANLGLRFHISYYTNWGGMNEKWMLSSAKQWYFVTPDGMMYQWAGGTGVAGSMVVAYVGACCHTDPNLITDAATIGSFSASIAHNLDVSLGLKLSGSYSTNWGGLGEKWIRDAANNWYFITPSGGFYEWNGSKVLTGSRMLAALDVSYFVTPSRLHESVAPMAGSAGVHSAAFAALGGSLASNSLAETNDAASLNQGTSQLAGLVDTNRSTTRVTAAGRSSSSLGTRLASSLHLGSSLQAVQKNAAIATRLLNESARTVAWQDTSPAADDEFNWLVDVTPERELDSLQLAFAELGSLGS